MTFAEAQNIVGGYVEPIRFPDGSCMLVNDEGRIHGLPVNQLATKVFLEYFKVSFFPIVGNAIMMTGAEAREVLG